MECQLGFDIANVEEVGKVQCSSNYQWNNQRCVPTGLRRNPGTLNEYEQCHDSDECKGDMYCDRVCSCRAVYMRFDRNLNRCVRREYGDVCNRDDHCKTYANPWVNWEYNNFEGYNYHEGVCKGQRCACQNDVSTVNISYIQDNGIWSTKTICIVPGASQVDIGQKCTLNPIGYGSSTSTSYCKSGEICHQCPEDYLFNGVGTQSGRCREPTEAQIDKQSK